MICRCCHEREAHPEALGLCETCDDEPELNAFAFCRDVIGDATQDRSTREVVHDRR